MKSAHSPTLSNELRHFSTCCVYFLYFGSEAYPGGVEATGGRSRDIERQSPRAAELHSIACNLLPSVPLNAYHGERLGNSPTPVLGDVAADIASEPAATCEMGCGGKDGG